MHWYRHETFELPRKFWCLQCAQQRTANCETKKHDLSQRHNTVRPLIDDCTQCNGWDAVNISTSADTWATSIRNPKYLRCPNTSFFFTPLILFEQVWTEHESQNMFVVLYYFSHIKDETFYHDMHHTPPQSWQISKGPALSHLFPPTPGILFCFHSLMSI